MKIRLRANFSQDDLKVDITSQYFLTRPHEWQEQCRDIQNKKSMSTSKLMWLGSYLLNSWSWAGPHDIRDGGNGLVPLPSTTPPDRMQQSVTL